MPHRFHFDKISIKLFKMDEVNFFTALLHEAEAPTKIGCKTSSEGVYD
jgi:hypothetical protein